MASRFIVDLVRDFQHKWISTSKIRQQTNPPDSPEVMRAYYDTNECSALNFIRRERSWTANVVSDKYNNYSYVSKDMVKKASSVWFLATSKAKSFEYDWRL